MEDARGIRAALAAMAADDDDDEDDDEDEKVSPSKPAIGDADAVLMTFGLDSFKKKGNKESYGWSMYFQSKPRDWRRWLLARPWNHPVASMHLAACTIQQFRRYYMAKHKIIPTLEKEVPSAAVEADDEELVELKAARASKAKEALRQRYLLLMQRSLENRFASGRSGPVHRGYRNFQQYCAALIQAWWRGFGPPTSASVVRRTLRLLTWKKHALPQLAALVVQISVRRWQQVKPKTLVEVTQELQADVKRLRAVQKIQRRWRGANDVRMFRVLKDLITFKHQGDPHLLLRSMCPRESQLLDPACRNHVRLRLGGTSFPPQIYYKIFARGVVDINAFAPREYCDPRRAITYERYENNGWRALSGRPGAEKDEIEWHTGRKRERWNHVARIRHEVRRKRRIDRRLVWIEKMRERREDAASAARVARAPLTDRGPRAAHGAESPPLARPGSAEPALRAPAPGGAGPQEESQDTAALRDEDSGVVPPTPGATGVEEHVYEAAAGEEEEGKSPEGKVERVLTSIDNPEDTELLIDWTRALDFDAYIKDWECVGTSLRSDGYTIENQVPQKENN